MKKDKPRFTSAKNRRNFVFKYYPIKGDKIHKMAVPAGRCYKCHKITDSFCDNCNAWACKNHLSAGKHKDEEFCSACIKGKI